MTFRKFLKELNWATLKIGWEWTGSYSRYGVLGCYESYSCYRHKKTGEKRKWDTR